MPVFNTEFTEENENFTIGCKSLTVDAFVQKTSSSSGILRIVCARKAEFIHFLIHFDRAQKNKVYLENGKILDLPAIPPLKIGWHHVALVIQSGNSGVYIDGEQVEEMNTTIFEGIRPTSSMFIAKSERKNGASGSKIMGLRIYKNRALTPAEIKDYLKTPLDAGEKKLVFYYR